jgi:3-oxoadipate enol-lactonase
LSVEPGHADVRTEEVDGVTEHLRYDLLATGDQGVIVLLHSLALDATIWTDFARQLPSGATVIAPDLPGHGRDPRGDPASVESMADGVAALLRSLELSDVTLIGMSLGGSVAQAVAIGHPGLVGRLGLIDTTAWYGPDAPAAWAARSRQAAEQGLASLAGFQLTRWFTEPFNVATPELGRRLLEIFQNNDIDDYVASCTALGAMDLRARLGEITVPTAIAVGEYDAATPPAMAEALAEAIDDSTLTVIASCKHLSALEKPREVVAALAAILDRSPRA